MLDSKATDDTPLRVLALDDEPGVVRMMGRLLQMPGVELTTCQEIEAARSLVRCFPFDVVVTDLQVSRLGGLEGMRLVHFLRTHFPSTQVLVHTAHMTDDAEVHARSLGVSGVYRKPHGIDGLREHIAGLKQERSANPEHPGRLTQVGLLGDYLGGGNVTSVLQPIVAIDGAEAPFSIHGVECLARGPRDTPLSNPGLLFSYATEKEALFETDMLCLRAGMSEAQSLGHSPHVFINVNPRSLSHPEFAAVLQDHARATGLSPSSVVLEMTEQANIINSRAFYSTLAQVRELGYRVALDDFGEGHSNLQVLRDLRPEYLKISGVFCEGVVDDSITRKIVATQSDLARSLGIRTIMEFVETPEQAHALRELGVELGQGYYFSRPDAADALCASSRFEWTGVAKTG